MKFVSYKKHGNDRAALLINNRIYDLQNCAENIGIQLPSTMNQFLKGEDNFMISAFELQKEIIAGTGFDFLHADAIKYLAPVPFPTSCRDGYAFRQHVATARRNRGVDMIPEFDQFPIFYLTNHNAIFGEGDIVLEKDHFENLDFELEAAIVIGHRGKNISSKDADKYIAGYMVMNDLSARRLQMEEMKLNLGPAKGKDFATTIGPWLVTPDELEKYKIKTGKGNKYDLGMTAFHNGKQVSNGNMKDMNWTFAEIIERASYGVELLPGDVIGSGTVGTGCYLELNGTWALEAKEKKKEFEPIWIKPGDTMELEIQGLGRLKNTLLQSKNDYSILAKKKNI
ncbi:MAG: fumarylacetoacetate hydrolase [Ignavibacteriales bacterium CG_4_9_14_3_um_filter_30_11]|nr:MAG: fumarylacetoacetate hydrolase [Ignavibacteriales bacterium CG_4_9_14_3_um_filter_30_11]